MSLVFATTFFFFFFFNGGGGTLSLGCPDRFCVRNFWTPDIDCGYSLEQPHGGSSNIYPQCHRTKIRKIMCTPVKKNGGFEGI